jgi:hypothetical protein
MLKKEEKKQGDIKKYLCFVCIRCWVWVGGRDPFDIIADPNFGPIQRIFYFYFKRKKWPKDF